MKDMIDGPPTKPGEYRIVTVDGWQEWGHFNGSGMSTGSADTDYRTRVSIAKHAPLDAPAPEWLPAERLGEFVGKLVSIRLKNPGSGHRTRSGKLVSEAVNGCYAVGNETFAEWNIEKFCVHELPPDPPAAQRDVFDMVANELTKVPANRESFAIVLAGHFGEMQQENERLRKQISESRADEMLQRRDREIERLKQELAEQHNEATAEPEKESLMDYSGCTSVGGSAPSLPTPRRFRCKWKRGGRPIEGIEFRDWFSPLRESGVAIKPFWICKDDFEVDHTDIEFLPEPLLASKVQDKHADGEVYLAERRENGTFAMWSWEDAWTVTEEFLNERFTRV